MAMRREDADELDGTCTISPCASLRGQGEGIATSGLPLVPADLAPSEIIAMLRSGAQPPILGNFYHW